MRDSGATADDQLNVVVAFDDLAGLGRKPVGALKNMSFKGSYSSSGGGSSRGSSRGGGEGFSSSKDGP